METKTKLLILSASIVTILALVPATLFASTFYFSGKSIPSQSYLGKSVSGLSYSDLQEKVEVLDNDLSQEVVHLNYEEQSTTFFLQDILLDIDNQQVINEALFYQGRPTVKQLLTDFRNKTTFNPTITLNDISVAETLSQKLTNLTATQNAKFLSTTEIQPEQSGVDIDLVQLQTDIQMSIDTNTRQIKIDDLKVTTSEAQVVVADLEAIKPNLVLLSENPIQINYLDNSYQLSLFDKINSINFSKDTSNQLQAELDQEFLVNYLNQTIRPQVYEAPGKLEIKYNSESDKAEFTEDSKQGTDLNVETTLLLVNQALTNTLNTGVNNPVDVATISLEPELVIDDILKERGVTELIETGYTTFHGSTVNRIHNINVGMEKFNGLIIPAGEEFSFNQNLGPVDASTGYRPELVIKSFGTIPEYGGGLCQVSSTMYRAALFSGLDITERDNHSYAVGYYAQVLGHGLDATIYPGVKDLKFVNNTGSDIVVQAYAEGTSAYFKFYGTKHIDRVELVGPINSNYRSPGPEAVTVDPSLPAGTVKVLDTPVTGFDSYWERVIYDKENNKTVEEIFSDYRAVNRKLTVSPDYYAPSTPVEEEAPEVSSTES